MKRVISIMLCLLLLPCLAAGASGVPLVDEAQILDAQQETSLGSIIDALSNTYDLDIVILTTTDLNGKSARDYADDYLEANFGANGVLFLLDMGGMQWHISTMGTAIDLLSDGDLIKIEDEVIPLISSGRYYDGFSVFLDLLPGLLEPQKDGISFGLSILGGAVIAGIGLAVMAGSMRSNRPKPSAADYTVEGSYRLRQQRDLFLYSNVTKRAKPKENSSGSSTHRSSSGRTHGGRGGKF